MSPWKQRILRAPLLVRSSVFCLVGRMVTLGSEMNSEALRLLGFAAGALAFNAVLHLGTKNDLGPLFPRYSADITSYPTAAITGTSSVLTSLVPALVLISSQLNVLVYFWIPEELIGQIESGRHCRQ